METKRKKLGEILIEEKVIDEMQLKAALGHQQQWGGKLGTTLIEMSFVTERALADELGAPAIGDAGARRPRERPEKASIERRQEAQRSPDRHPRAYPDARDERPDGPQRHR